MPKPQKEPLRVLDEQEQKELQRIVGATSERMDVINTQLLAEYGGVGAAHHRAPSTLWSTSANRGRDHRLA